MARKKSSTKAARAKSRARRRRTNPDAVIVDDGSSLKEIGEFILWGFGGYAATRLLQRAVYSQLVKKFPQASRHVAAVSGAASFLAAWYVSGYWSRTERYRLPISIGSGIAAAQTILQTYVPKFGWIVSDFQPVLGSASQPAQAKAQPTQQLPPPPPQETAVEFVDEDGNPISPEDVDIDETSATGDEDVVNPFLGIEEGFSEDDLMSAEVH